MPCVVVAVAVVVVRVVAPPPSPSSQALPRFTTRPMTATASASPKAMGTGVRSLSNASTAISAAVRPSAMALAKPARSPNLPVPKAKRGSSA